MQPSLTWLDLTASDRDKMRRVLDLFSEQGTIDELGLGSLRDALSDELFPGTSSIQTRLRYFLFVPWIYLRLEAAGATAPDVVGKARDGELQLIGPLLEADDSEGVIGARARGSLTRLPSSVYWAGLVRWGIFQHAQSQSWYHNRVNSLSGARGEVGRADDPGVVWTKQPNWHVRLPKPPAEFPRQASFSITAAEAEFLQGRIVERCSGSLLAWLVHEGSEAPASSFWSDATALRAPADILQTIELARRFSLHVEGAPLLYNLLLAEKRKETQDADGDDKRMETYRQELAKWATEEGDQAPFDPKALWWFAARAGTRVPSPQLRFVEAWSRRVVEVGAVNVADDQELRTLIEQRERQLKGGRARLANSARLLDWSGRVGVGRMDFRWFRVRQLLMDLQQGLKS